MPQHTQPEPEHKGDTDAEMDDEDLRDTIPDSRVSRVRQPQEEQEDIEEIELEPDDDDDESDARSPQRAVDIDVDALPQLEGEGPDA